MKENIQHTFFYYNLKKKTSQIKITFPINNRFELSSSESSSPEYNTTITAPVTANNKLTILNLLNISIPISTLTKDVIIGIEGCNAAKFIGDIYFKEKTVPTTVVNENKLFLFYFQ